MRPGRFTPSLAIANAPGIGYGEAASNHSPFFYVNEDALQIGVRALATLAVDCFERQRNE